MDSGIRVPTYQLNGLRLPCSDKLPQFLLNDVSCTGLIKLITAKSVSQIGF